jgi:ABC-2 type transport system ATP-binding protein
LETGWWVRYSAFPPGVRASLIWGGSELEVIMLEVNGLRKSFGAFEAVKGVTFSAGKGEVLGFLGPNGAGKTTTMRMITGFLPPSAGTAVVNGHDIATDAVEAKRQIGYLPENAPTYDSMTVSDFLLFTADVRGFRGGEKKDMVEKAIEKCRLEKVRRQTIDTLSKGYRQRTCFAQAILHDPPILIMDEPTDGLDPNQKHLVREMIRQMAPEKTIVVSTHILEEVDAVCTRAIIISNGTIVANGTPKSLRDRSPTGRLDDIFRMLTLGKEGSVNE